MTLDRKIENERWLELPEDFRTRVTTYLKENLSPEFLNGIREAFKENPEGWWSRSGWHFGQGMSVRNLLRRRGFRDEQLPTGNWDDYYIQAIEDAAGVINDI